MTKADEMKILADAAKKLGDDSYLGNALAELIPFVDSQIRSDIFPDLAGTIRELERNLIEQRAELKRIEGTIKMKETILKETDCNIRRSESAFATVKESIGALANKLQYYS